MSSDRAGGLWTRIAQESLGDPVTLAHVCAAAARALAVDGAAVVVMSSTTVRETVHATDRVAAELEEWQLAFGEGPSVDAFAGAGPVLAPALDAPGYVARWPVFTPAALASGARAVFALPLQIGAIRLGVLTLHRRRSEALSASELADALSFAHAAGMLLLDGAADAPPNASELAWQLDDPTAHQAQVHQATGMILAQLGISAEAAFARLRAYAFANDRRLGDVAAAVVARRLRLEPDLPSGGHDGP